MTSCGDKRGRRLLRTDGRSGDVAADGRQRNGHDPGERARWHVHGHHSSAEHIRDVPPIMPPTSFRLPHPVVLLGGGCRAWPRR